jgi:membrane protein CcdC involved in cytochrome C biogenesis
MWLGDLAANSGVLATLAAIAVHWVSVPLALVLAGGLSENVTVKGLGPAFRVMGVYAVSHIAAGVLLWALGTFFPVDWLVSSFLVGFGVSLLLIRSSAAMVKGVDIKGWRSGAFVTLLSFAATWLITHLVLG